MFCHAATYCNDHDWGDNVSYDLENLFKTHDEYVCGNIECGFGEVMTLFNPTILKECQLCMHVDHRDKFYMIVILFNLMMILYIIIMREENMVVEIFMLLNYISLC